MNNLRQIGLATVNCAATYDGALPPAWGNFPPGSNSKVIIDPKTTPMGPPYGTQVWILPFMEQQNAFNQVPLMMADTSAGPYGTYPRIKTFECPSDWGIGETPPGYKAPVGQCSYQNNALVFAGGFNLIPSTSPGVPPTVDRFTGADVNEGYDVFVGGVSRYPASIPDGTSNTILWTETVTGLACGVSPYTWCQNWKAYNLFQSSFIGWYKAPPNAFFYPGLTAGQCAAAPRPNGIIIYDEQASSAHPAAVMAGLADGSVRALSQGMTQYTYNVALIPNDGLVLPADW